jgi:hypothetical protein
VNTIGIVSVTCLSAQTDEVFSGRMTSGLEPISSCDSRRACSTLPPLQRSLAARSGYMAALPMSRMNSRRLMLCLP